MTYNLDLFFKPAIERRRILEYFAARKHYKLTNDDVVYKHPDTGVYFFVTLRCGRDILLRRTVVSAEFEINFFRPSYFAIEAERELSAFVAAFRPRIEDPQIRGMEQGPYSGDGFLSGWNFGNAFSIRNAGSRPADFGVESMPRDDLYAAWTWNYHRAERSKWFRGRLYVPCIIFFRIEGRPSRVAVWPLGNAVSLPKVDYVLVVRLVSGETRYGLARWSEVLDVVQRAGFDTATDPLDLEYFLTPPPIAEWIANIPLFDPKAVERLSAYKVLDDDLIAAARESVEQPSDRA
jgi:hypothetical protein